MAKLKTGRHTSALKAQRQSEKKADMNKGHMKRTRLSAKNLLTAVAEKKTDSARKLLAETASYLDKAAKKGVIHWKTAARKKSRLAKRVGKISA